MKKIGFLLIPLAFLLLASCGGSGEVNQESSLDPIPVSNELKAVELNDSPSGAATFVLNTNYADSLSSLDTVDWWKVQVSQLGNLVVNLTVPCTADFELELFSYNNLSTPLIGSYGGLCQNERVAWPMSYSGWYYVKVRRYSGSGSYGLSATVDSAAFAGETIPDGTDFAPNTNFTKTWTLRNSGWSTWTSGYYLEYVSGSLSTSQSRRYISGSVSPGGSYIFSVPMRSPSALGNGYREDWRFKSPSGETINVGSSPTIWAMIDVIGSPNLTPYTPSGWSYPIVPSDIRGTNIVGNLSDCGPTYIDWATTNNGSAQASNSDVYFYIDDSLVWTWSIGIMNPGSITMSQDSERTFSAGSHTLRVVADATSRVAESNESDNAYQQTFTWQACPRPDLTSFTPSGWDGAIVASPSPGSNRDGILYECWPAYLDFAIRNTGSANANGTFYNYILIDGSYVDQWVENGLSAGASDTRLDYSISSRAGGQWHTVTMSFDATGAITESNEGNNSVSRNFYWYLCRSPTAIINSPADGARGVGDSVSFSGNCSDPDGDLSVAYVRNETTGWNGAWPISGGSASFSTDIPLTLNRNSLLLTCQDGAGDTGNSRVSVTRLCPDGSNPDNVRDPCNHNDNGELDMRGNNISETIVQGQINQTSEYTITNTGSGNLYYTVRPEADPNWLTVVKNGGETNAFDNTHTLEPLATDTYRVSLNSTGRPPDQNVSTNLIATNAYAGDDADSRTVNMRVENAPYCPAEPPYCAAPPVQKMGAPQTTSGTVSDPINTATGNYIYSNADLSLSGRGLPLSFVRTYNSQDEYLGPLGIGWTHTFNIVLTEASDNSVQIKWGDGHTEIYTLSGGNYINPIGVFSTLTKNGDGSFNLVTKDFTTFAFGANGQLATITDRKGNQITLAYTDDRFKRLNTVADSVGNSLTFNYTGDDLKISSVADSAGRSVSFTYSGDNLAQFTSAAGGIYQYLYNDPQGNLTDVIDPRNNTVVHNTYDSYSRVETQRDALNHTTTLTYQRPDPTQGQQVTVRDPLNRAIVHQYNAQLSITTNQDPLGRNISYGYNSNLLRTSVTDRNGRQLQAVYDNLGNITRLTDPLNATTQFEYDTPANGDVNRIIFPNTHQRNFEYDGEGNLTRVYETVDGVLIESLYRYNEWGQMTRATDPEGHITIYNYYTEGSSIGLLSSVTDGGGGITRFTYDPAGRVQTVTAPLERVSRYQYDANDNITGITDAENNIVQYHYTNGVLDSITDQNNNVTHVAFNENEFLSSATNVLNGINVITSFDYDELNRRTSVTDAENRMVQYRYNDPNDAGKLSSIRDPLGRVVQYDYDPEGNLASVIDTAGQTWGYTSDELGRVTRSRDPLGNITRYEYNPVTGTLSSITDAENRVTQFRYDAIGRLESVIDPMNQTTSYQYDRAGNLTALTNADRQTTNFTYNPTSGRLETQTNALGEVERYLYNLVGELNTFTNGRNEATTYTYRPTGRIESITYADGSSVGYTYYANGNRRTRRDTLGTTNYNYDELNRLTSVSDPRGFNIGYDYDRTGLITSLTYPGARAVSYTYNSAGQLSSVRDWLRNTTNYTYDPTAGRLQNITYPNRFATVYGYDDASRLTELINRRADGSVLSSYNFTLNNVGVRTAVVKQEPLVPQIIAENITSTYNEENELLPLDVFGYDENGNLTLVSAPSGATNYSFDARDLLSSITSPSGASSFIYDGDGNRVSSTLGGETTKFIVNPNAALPSVVAEANASNEIQNYYIYGLGLTAQVSADGSQIRYYHYDPIGSTIALSDAGGAVTDQYVYDEFGGLNRKTGNTANPFQFVGQFGVQNDGTGLYHMRARYYDPKAGRFISRDPIGMAGGMNLYNYAHNNPIQLTDPDGQNPILVAAGAACGLGAIWGAGTTLFTDLYVSAKQSAWSFQDISTYGINTLGGCGGGLTAAVALVGLKNPWAAGALGGAVSLRITSSLEGREPSSEEVGIAVGGGALLSGGASKIIPKVPGPDPKTISRSMWGTKHAEQEWEKDLLKESVKLPWEIYKREKEFSQSQSFVLPEEIPGREHDQCNLYAMSCSTYSMPGIKKDLFSNNNSEWFPVLSRDYYLQSGHMIFETPQDLSGIKSAGKK